MSDYTLRHGVCHLQVPGMSGNVHKYMDIYKQKIKLTVQDKDPLYYANMKIYHFKELIMLKQFKFVTKTNLN